MLTEIAIVERALSLRGQWAKRKKQTEEGLVGEKIVISRMFRTWYTAGESKVICDDP